MAGGSCAPARLAQRSGECAPSIIEGRVHVHAICSFKNSYASCVRDGMDVPGAAQAGQTQPAEKPAPAATPAKAAETPGAGPVGTAQVGTAQAGTAAAKPETDAKAAQSFRTGVAGGDCARHGDRRQGQVRHQSRRTRFRALRQWQAAENHLFQPRAQPAGSDRLPGGPEQYEPAAVGQAARRDSGSDPGHAFARG